MIGATIHLECDACGRKTGIEFSKLFRLPDLATLLISTRWGQYLNAAVLCPECCNDGEQAARVQQIHQAAVAGLQPLRKSHSDAEILLAIKEAGSMTKAAKLLGIGRSSLHRRTRLMRHDSNTNGFHVPQNRQENSGTSLSL